MDILEETDVFLSACQLTQDESNNLVFNGITGCFESKYLADWFVNQINFGWKLWQEAKAKAVPEGFVEKTESNTHHYFKLKDWNEWSCIDVIKDAITSDYDINSIVEVEQLEVVEIQQSTKYGLLRFAKRHGDEVVFFDSLEEAQQAQEPAND